MVRAWINSDSDISDSAPSLLEPSVWWSCLYVCVSEISEHFSVGSHFTKDGCKQDAKRIRGARQKKEEEEEEEKGVSGEEEQE